MKTTALSHCAAAPACRTTAPRSLPARLKQLTLTAAAALTFVLAPAASAATPPLVDIGINYSYPDGMNQSGQFVGRGETSPGSGVHQGFVVDPATGSVQFLPPFGTREVVPDAINDSGLVLGSYFPGGFDVYGSAIRHGFVWSAATGYRDITPTATYSAGSFLNNAGQVAGTYTLPSGFNHGFFWNGTVMTDLGTFGGSTSIVEGMNSHGQIVGYAYRADETWAPFIWDATNGMREIPAGQDNAQPFGISDAGVVFMRDSVTGGVLVWDAVNGARTFADPLAGQTPFGFISPMWQFKGFTSDGQAVFGTLRFIYEEAYVLDPVTGWQTIAFPGGDPLRVRPTGFSKSGNVVGYGLTATGEQRAFIWDKVNGIRGLGTLPGGSSSQPTAVNDLGQVTGYADLAAAPGTQFAFLWDAVNGMQNLGTPAGATESFGLTIRNGALAGYANYADGSQRAFYAKLSNATGAPDLQVTALTTTNNKAPQGQKVTVTAIVKNTGTAAAGASTTVIKDGTTVLATVATPPLGAGDSVTLTLDLRTAAQNGTHVLSVSADTANTVSESDEANNTRTLTVVIKGNKVL